MTTATAGKTTEKSVNVMYHCKSCKLNLRKSFTQEFKWSAKHTLESTHLVRSDGKRIIGHSDKVARIPEESCQSCGKEMIKKEIKGYTNTEIACSPKCEGATGHVCECECGGLNHGGKWNG